jgi:uncharacterized protein YbjT (DUF2867 family)
LRPFDTASGVGHHVALSVVGTERLLESGFFGTKLAQENLIKASSNPYWIVRATQFFEFVKQIADFSSFVGGLQSRTGHFTVTVTS